MVPLKIEWYASTDVGAVRQVNEDRSFGSDALALWLVADGMGGMSRGDWAATQVVETLGGVGRSDDLATMVETTAAALRQANDAIVAESAAQGKQMGTTAVALIVRDRAFAVLWVGDSRAYLVRDRRLHRLTRDHSQVQEMMDRGLIDAAGAATHPMRHVLTRAVGIETPLAIDSVTDTLAPDDLILLCSDGLCGVVSEAELEATLVREPTSRVGAVLIGRCHELGAPDNITLIAVVAAEATRLQLDPGALPL